MNALIETALLLALATACGGSGASSSSDMQKPIPSVASAARTETTAAPLQAAGGASDAPPITEEELQRLLDALEQEIGNK